MMVEGFKTKNAVLQGCRIEGYKSIGYGIGLKISGQGYTKSTFSAKKSEEGHPFFVLHMYSLILLHPYLHPTKSTLV